VRHWSKLSEITLKLGAKVQSSQALLTTQSQATAAVSSASMTGNDAAAILSGKSLAAAELIELGGYSSSDESSDSNDGGSGSTRVDRGIAEGADRQHQQDSSLSDGLRPPKPPREHGNRGGMRLSSRGGAFADLALSDGTSNEGLIR
jgi:hypothetical protein